MFSSCRHVVFDLDGTLIDSRNGVLFSLQESCFSIDGEVREISENTIGPPVREMIESIAPDFSTQMIDKAVLEFRRLYDESFWADYIVYEGVVEVLEKLNKNYYLHIATNKPIIPTEKICTDLGIARFLNSINCFDASLHTKKADLLSNFKNSPSGALMIGDTRSDLEAANEIGMSFILCNYGFGKGLASKYSVNDFYELEEMLL